MSKCQQIINIMEKIAPRHLAEEWDNPGLLVGSPQREVKKILIALDVTERTVDLAINTAADMIISHHPLIFKPFKKIRTDLPNGKLLQKILRHDLAVFAAHTNLDAAAGGVNDVLAARLGLTKVEPLVKAESGEPGLGRIGFLPESVGIIEFVRILKNALNLTDARLVSSETDLVKKVALCGGSGAEFIGKAAFLGADVYITGDVRYHDAQLAKELDIHLIDAGHFGTEFPVVEALADRLRKELSDAASETEVITDGQAKNFWITC